MVAHKTCVVVLFTSFGLRTLCHDHFFSIRTLFVVVTISPPRSLFQAGGQLGPKKLKTIARGITTATAAALLPEHGGTVKYSKTWGKRFAEHKLGYDMKRATTDRCTDTGYIVRSSEQFWLELHEVSQNRAIKAKNTYNYDEWWCLLEDGHASGTKMTYVRRSDQSVAGVMFLSYHLFL